MVTEREMWLAGGDKSEAWDEYAYTTIFKIDN